MNEDKELIIKVFAVIKAVEDIDKEDNNISEVGDILGAYIVQHLEDKEVFLKFVEWVSKTPNTSKSYNAFNLRKHLYAGAN